MTYIEDGEIWDSRLERDCAIAQGVFWDACIAWTGDDDAMPNILDALIKAEVLLDNYEAAIDACKREFRWIVLLGVLKN